MTNRNCSGNTRGRGAAGRIRTAQGLADVARHRVVASLLVVPLAAAFVVSGTFGADESKRSSAAAAENFGSDRVVVYKTVGDVALRLYLFEPKTVAAGSAAGDASAAKASAKQKDAAGDAAKHPAIVFFFGGGWKSGTPKQFRFQAEYLARRGMLAALAEYRVYNTHRVKVTECVADAKSAVRWLRVHAEELHIDPNRIAAAGGSAGGHLAAATATLAKFDAGSDVTVVSAVPNALVLFNPALDLLPESFNKPFRAERYQQMAERLGASPEDLSPSRHVRSGLPPTIIFHGEGDTTVPITQARTFCEKMKKAGNSCSVVGYAGQPHGFFNYGRSENRYFADTLRKADAFFVKLGWLPPLPPAEKNGPSSATRSK